MPARGAVRRAVAAIVVCAACALGSPAVAQYFGRNKVQYHPLTFEVLRTEHFDIYFIQARVENGAERLPLWFIEGMAEYFSIGPVDSNTARRQEPRAVET